VRRRDGARWWTRNRFAWRQRATNQLGNEGIIFRFVFWHSIALGAIVGIIVMVYAYVLPQFVPHV